MHKLYFKREQVKKNKTPKMFFVVLFHQLFVVQFIELNILQNHGRVLFFFVVEHNIFFFKSNFK